MAIILSGRTKRDWNWDKFALYEEKGVEEYWLVDPIDQIVQVFTAEEGGKYGRPAIYDPTDQVKVGIFPDLVIDLPAVFGETKVDESV